MKVATTATFPGLDGIRLLAAWAVVFSHCYPIAAGPAATDPLYRITGGHVSVGDDALYVFFLLSGFLLSASLHANPDPLRYLVNRLFRIVPGFCFAIVVTVLLIAPALSPLRFGEVMGSGEAWRSIFWSIVGLDDRTGIPLSASRYPGMAGTLNGSLWTIPYEMVCYLVLLALFMVQRTSARVGAAALMLIGLSFAWPSDALATLPYAFSDKTLPFFCGGVLCHAWYRRWGVPRPLFFTALAVLLGSALTGQHAVAVALLAPAVIIPLGARPGWLSRLTDRIGDVSYGVYLFGWPVSLLVAAWSGSVEPLVVFAVTVPIVLGLAWVMHQLVEKPVANVVKPCVLRWLPRRVDRAASTATRYARVCAGMLCLVACLRFVLFPLPWGANWFGSMWPQLAGLCIVMALVLKAGDRMSRATIQQATATPNARIPYNRRD